MRGWISDLGFAVRIIARKPQSSLMLILTLALGITITTSMFSVLDAVLLRPLPYVDPSRVVLLPAAVASDFGYWNTSHTFEHIAVYSSGGVNLFAGGAATRAQIAQVSPDYFAVFGVEPIAGTSFGTVETRASEITLRSSATPSGAETSTQARPPSGPRSESMGSPTW